MEIFDTFTESFTKDCIQLIKQFDLRYRTLSQKGIDSATTVKIIFKVPVKNLNQTFFKYYDGSKTKAYEG